MANHDIYSWWWSKDGPQVNEKTSINGVVENLLKAREKKIVSGKNEDLSDSGWNYAVLNFLSKR